MNIYSFRFIAIFLMVLNCGFSQTSSKNTEELSLVFIGDFMGHLDQINAAYNSQNKTYDYNDCFKYVKPILSNADITIGNLEVTLGIKPYSGYPQFSSPASYASAIKNAGVDVLMTANNHSCDKRKQGIEKTIEILDSLKISHTGTFINKVEKDLQSPLILIKNGFKLAFLNYTYDTNGIPPTHPNIVNYLNKKTIAEDVKSAKLLNPDEIIVFVHWGIQYEDLPSKKQKDWFSYFQSLGVRIVIGSHPHVLQPMILKNDNLVVYSLGNFISHQRTFPRDGGAIFKLNLIKEKNKVKIKNATYNLTWVYEPIINGQKKYFILPVKDFENNSPEFLDKKNYNKMMRFANHARILLGKENIGVKEN
jgi:poly-gamma-glutamate capsule biosynthesis protein CapA/YwtB (metallophosphatase superfamily)